MPRSVFAYLVIAGLASAATAQPADEDAAPDFPYTNELGEEIFGPGYLPVPADDAGEVQRVGNPSAGFQVPAATPMVSQSVLAKAIPESMTWNAPSVFAPLTQSAAARLGKPAKTVAPDNPPAGVFREMMWSDAPLDTAESAAEAASMKVHFVYVGQGSGAIVELPCGTAVIDTGGQWSSGTAGARLFNAYLDSFFASRPNLNRTIDLLVTSHPHADHLGGLDRFKMGTPDQKFAIRNIVDDGLTEQRGSVGVQTNARNVVQGMGGRYSAIEFAAQNSATGTTNSVIDPFRKCKGVDPVVTAFWGGRAPELNGGVYNGPRIDFHNPNNHSVVIRIDFGKASVLFTGDLEADGIDGLLYEYQANPGVFDVTALVASHHGAVNGTSDDFLRATTPQVEIISMGDRQDSGKSTAKAYGHPRRVALDIMQKPPEVVADTRPAKTFWVYDEANGQPKPYPVTRAIYGTGWEGSLVLELGSDGKWSVASAP